MDNNKKYMIIGYISILVIIVLGVLSVVYSSEIAHLFLKEETTSTNSDKKKDTVKSHSYTNYVCFLSDENGNPYYEIYYEASNQLIGRYGKGDYLSCTFTLSKTLNKNGISFNVVSDSVDVVKLVKDSDEEWTRELTKNEDGSYFVKEYSSNSTLAAIDVQLVLLVKERNDVPLNINFKDITAYVKKDDVVKEKEFEDKIITIENSDSSCIGDLIANQSRYYQKDGAIVLSKLAEDGSFKVAGEYKCNKGSVKNLYYPSCHEGYNMDIMEISCSDEGAPYYAIFEIGKGVLNTFDHMAWLEKDNMGNWDHDNCNSVYLYAKDYETGYYGILDKQLNLVHKYNMEEMNVLGPGGPIGEIYSIKDNMIVAKKNGKYGISKITSEETVIDYQFDLIRLFLYEDISDSKNSVVSNKYFKAQKDGKWYLYSFETKEKAIDKGYDYLFMPTDSVIVVGEDNYLYVKDTKGNNLTDDKIPNLADRYDEWDMLNPGIYTTLTGDIITISSATSDWIYNQEDKSKRNTYEYNIKTKTLTEKTE